MHRKMRSLPRSRYPGIEKTKGWCGRVTNERKWNPVRSQTCGHLRAAHNYQSNPEDEWTDEDITLIASSPALLEALEELVDFASLDHKHIERSIMAFTTARLAIAKAKGEI